MLTQIYASLLALTLDWQVLSGVSTPAVLDLVPEEHNAAPAGQVQDGDEEADHPLVPRWDAGFGAVTKCTVPGTVALTFDDGPFIYTNDIVGILKGANATATFFYNGKNFGCIYDSDSVERVKLVYNSGHQVASHTWRHADLATLSWDEIHDEMWKVENALLKIVGVTPAFMRPPYGSYNDLVLRAASVRQQTVVIWDFDSQDSSGAAPDTCKDSYSQVISRHPETILTLNHETSENTAKQVLPFAIQQLQQAGYRLVSVAECLGKLDLLRFPRKYTAPRSLICQMRFISVEWPFVAVDPMRRRESRIQGVELERSGMECGSHGRAWVMDPERRTRVQLSSHRGTKADPSPYNRTRNQLYVRGSEAQPLRAMSPHGRPQRKPCLSSQAELTRLSPRGRVHMRNVYWARN
ncbi:hypothetical protein NMY22_g13519 [Coprinellus aureogranulatus]|nr:hypothetical protein NMY22_g13519 [Coprinellus aureogranulatus]